MKKFHSAELLAKQPKKIEYIVHGLIPAGGICDISGPPGEGKSTIALSLANSISTGTGWFGVKTNKAAVAWVSGELSGADAAARDLHRLKADSDCDITFLLPDSEMFRFDSKNEVWITTVEGKAVLAEIFTLGIKVAFFDTNGSIVAGSKEIDNDQQRQLARHIKREANGLTVITISHTNQSSARDELSWRLHYLSRAGGNGFPGAIRWAAGVSAIHLADASLLGLKVEDVNNRHLVGFGVSKNNEMPTPNWTNKRPAIFEITADGGLVLVKSGTTMSEKQAKKNKYARTSAAAGGDHDQW